MIIDHEETTRTGMISLLKPTAGRMTEETLALPVIRPEAGPGDDEDSGETETRPIPEPGPREPLPPLDPPWFVPKGVAQETGTHALPAVKKITGKPSTAADLHRLAASAQKTYGYLGVVIWYGESTKEFWVMDSVGLHSFPSVTDMYKGMGW